MRLRFGVEADKEIRQALDHIAEKIVDKVASNKKSDLETALLAAFVRAEEGENARKGNQLQALMQIALYNFTNC